MRNTAWAGSGGACAEASRGAIDVEARLASLARARAPLRRALARIAGRLVSTRAWERLGFARLSDYARERAGLSARQLQDLAHVDARLGALPCVEVALLRGELTWTKARLLARVAEAADEARWVAFARGVSARALEHEVRAVDRGAVEAGALEVDEDGASTSEKEWVIVRCTSRVQAKFHRARAGDARAANVCALHGPAPGVAPEVAALLEGLPDADAFELDARLRCAAALEQRVDAELAPLLRRACDARLHRRAGFASFGLWVRERLGLSPRKVRALRRLERAAAVCPPLWRAFAGGRLSWPKAQVLAPLLLLPEAERFRGSWVDRAERTTVRRLEQDVDAALLLLSTERAAFLEGGGLPDRPTCAPATPSEAPPTAAPAPTAAEETERFMFLAPRDVARLFRAVLCSARSVSGKEVTPGRAAEWMFEHAFDAWGANEPRTRREHRVFERDGWRCTVPGCTSYRNLHDHHIRFRSAGGSDDLSNRTTLCAFHHLRGVHAGRVRCRGRAPAGLRFELGIRPDRPPLAAYGPGEWLAVAR